MRRAWVAVVAWLALLAASPASPQAPSASPLRAERPPATTLVELFTAQGCAGCPDANDRVAALAQRDGLLVLSWSVDYWDYLGWRDTLARPEFTARQRAYAGRLSRRRLSTPQVVLNGASAGAITDAAQLERLVEAAAAPPRVDLRLAADGSRAWIGSGRPPSGGAEVWLVRYDPDPEAVTVRAGENRGRDLRATNSVRQLVRLGAWRGRPERLRLPTADDPELRTVIVLQGADGGPVLGFAAD